MSEKRKLRFLSSEIMIFIFLVMLLSPLFISSNLNLHNNTKKTFIIDDQIHTILETQFWDLTGTPIIIDDAFPDYSWDTTATMNAWCSGAGTWDDPFILENILMNGSQASSVITIRNSKVYFQIRNCRIENSQINSYGIDLEDVANGTIINNEFLNNDRAVVLLGCYNNTVVNNTFHNDREGINIWYSINTTIENNSIYDTEYTAIGISQNTNTTLHGNKMYGCGIYLSLNNDFDTITIDISNTINGKPVYYYVSEVGLTTVNFTDSGQILLFNCTNSLICNLNISHTTEGIRLIKSDNNTISNNTFYENRKVGIDVHDSQNNSIIGNSVYNEEDGGGINVAGCNQSIIEMNNISKGIHNSGIIVDNSFRTQISNNRIINTDRYDEIRNKWTQGVLTRGSTNTTMTNNYVYKHGFGYSVQWSLNTSMLNNSVDFCDNGIYLQQANNTRIIGNIVLKCQTNCFYEENCIENIYQRNYFGSAIKIQSPVPNEQFGQEPPSFNLQVNLPYEFDFLWYTVNNGLTNITCDLTGTIDPTMWTALPDGSVQIVFYTKDTEENIGSGFIRVLKQTYISSTTTTVPISTTKTITTAKSDSGFSLVLAFMALSLLLVIRAKRENHI